MIRTRFSISSKSLNKFGCTTNASLQYDISFPTDSGVFLVTRPLSQLDDLPADEVADVETPFRRNENASLLECAVTQYVEEPSSLPSPCTLLTLEWL